MKTNKKGFTLIELLTVIAVLGILVLLAAPKFLGYTERANIAKIQTGIKSVETVLDLNSLDSPELTKDWVVLTPDQLQEINDSGKLIDKNGFIKEDLDGGKYIPLKDLDSVKWNSGGEFILAKDEESVYYYNKDLNISKAPDGSATIPGETPGTGGETTPPVEEPESPTLPEYPIEHENGDSEAEDGTITKPDGTVIDPDGTIRNPDGSIIHPDGSTSEKQPDGSILNPDDSVTLPDGSVIPVATDSDFVWVNGSYPLLDSYYTVPNKGIGYYKYVGTKTKVSIPKTIDGYELTSYHGMFRGNSNVTKVVSYNKKITGMAYMFAGFNSTELDLNHFDTSNVVDMEQMFINATVTNLDVSKLNTSKVKNMNSTFAYIESSVLNLGNFNTSSATTMKWMFASTKNITSLDLKGFNTSNVTDMSGMFQSSTVNTINLNSFNTSKVTDMSAMFSSAKQLSSLDVNKFDTSNVTDMSNMFYQSNFEILDLSSFNTSKVSNTNFMFSTAYNLKNVYARTQEDLNKFYSSSDRPSFISFTVK